MMNNTFRKQFENNQLTHNNIVQIFKTRENEASLTEDENEIRNDQQNNRNKSKDFSQNNLSYQTKSDLLKNNSRKTEDINNTKHQNSKRISVSHLEHDGQFKDYYDTNILSPNAEWMEGQVQSGHELKDSFNNNNNDNKTFSFMRKHDDDTIMPDQNKSEVVMGDFSSHFNLRKNNSQQANSTLSQQSIQNKQRLTLIDPNNIIRQCSSMDDGGLNALNNNNNLNYNNNLEKQLKQGQDKQNNPDQQMQQSSESKPSISFQQNQNSPNNQSRPLIETKKRLLIESVNQRKKSNGLNLLRNKINETRQSEIDRNTLGNKKRKSNFLGVILKMKNYAYKMASTVESKRISILRRQKFEYLRDKSVVFSKYEREYNELYDYHPITNFVYKILQKILQNNCIKKFNEIMPTLPLFFPQSYWKFFWDLLNKMVVIVFFFFIPLHFIYNINFSTIFYFKTLDLSLSIISTFDLFINLNTAQFQKGNVLTKRTMIFVQYLSQDGLISLFFVIVIWIIAISERMDITQPLNNKFGFVCIIIVLLKLLSQNTLQNKINDRFYLKKVQRGIIQLMQIFFNLFIVSHLFASTWLVVGKYYQNDSPNSYCKGQSSYPPSCFGSWLDRLIEQSALTFYEEYLRAYYFTTVTMITVGYGDITPTNSSEYLLSILTMLIACGMFGYSLNSIGQILAEMNTDQKAFNEHFYAINGYMHQKNIPIDLQFQVREYLQYFFVQSNQEDQQKQQRVIRLLPDTLQNSVIFEANKIILTISPIFNEQVLERTIKIVEQKKYRPGELIIKQGIEDDCCIYFIEKGSVEIYNQSSNEELKILNKGQAFGEISFFTGMKRSSSIRSLEFTTLLAVKRSDFFDIVKNSPLDLEKFCMIKDSILFNNRYEGTGVFCFCCKSTSHIISECNFVHLCLDNFKVKNKLFLSSKLKFILKHHTIYENKYIGINNNKVIREYVKDEFQNREKDIQRREGTQNTLGNRTQVEDYAICCIEENIDELQKYGWFNDLVNKEFQNNLITRTNSIKNMIQMRTTSINDLSQIYHQNNYNNVPQTGNETNNNSHYNKQLQMNSNQNGVANIKIQFPYGKSISGNIRDREYDYYDTHSNMISEYSNNNLQKPSNNQFRRHSVKSEDGNSNILNFYQNNNKKVQFSVTSLPGVEEADYPSDRQQNNNNNLNNIITYNHVQSPPQIPFNLIQPHHTSSSYYQQISGGDYNTPTSRLRNPSQSDRVSSINVVSSNNHINFNQNTILNNQNYFSQVSGQTGSNLYANNSNSINVMSLNTQNLSNQQPNQLLKGFLTNQISNQSIQDFIQIQVSQQQQQQSQLQQQQNQNQTQQQQQIQQLQQQQQQQQQQSIHTPTNNNKNNNGNNHQTPPLKQREVSSVVQRGSKKRITIKTDINRKKINTNTAITKQISQMGGGNDTKQNRQSDALLKQLQEIMQIPQFNVINKDNTPFENLKNFSIYMPHNNHDRVILNYILFMRKKISTASIKKNKKSFQKLTYDETSSLKNNGTYASSKKKMSIKQYKEMISRNIDDQTLDNNKTVRTNEMISLQKL